MQSFPWAESLKRRLNRYLFWAAGGLTFAGMVIKAHRTGVTHDEAYTVDHFSSSLFNAWATYTAPNNHLLNSLAVHYAAEMFPGYEHNLRLPALLSGALALLCWGGIVRWTIEDRWIRCATFLFLPLNFYFFDLMYLARGYTFAHSAMLLFLLLTILYVRGAVALAPVVMFLALCNVVALGSILSHVLVMMPLNAVFLWSVWRRRAGQFEAYDRRTAWCRGALDALLAGIIVVAVSALGLGIVYAQVIDHLGGLLHDPSRVRFWPFSASLVQQWFSLGILQSWLLFFCLACLIARRLCDWRQWTFDWRAIHPSRVVVCGFGLTVFLTWFYIDGLGRRIGYPRNLSFFLPLLILFVGVIVDAGVGDLRRGARTFLLAILSLALAPALLRNLPSLNGIHIEKWNQQTCSAPLAKALTEIDPVRTWNIHFSEEARFAYRTMNYYGRRGYRVRTNERSAADVKMFQLGEAALAGVDRGQFLRPEYFAVFDCVVVKLRSF